VLLKAPARQELAFAVSAKMEETLPNILKWLGHSSWQLTTSTGTVFLIDPWLSENPLAPLKIEDLPNASHILITHDHSDHSGDAVAVAKQTGAVIVAQPETVTRLKSEGADKVFGMNVGGGAELDGVTVTMVDAYHSSQTGTPAGYVLELEDGKTLYHAGDTCLHSNMATWGDFFDIDVALLPIGSRYTMDGRQAARALKLLKPKMALPMHYRTFPALASSAELFLAEARQHAPDTTVTVIEPGDEFEF
jgi:L-ascorbate metabolism protein UlaG (beta-lactamase superfamily)